jgi:hypothetical protein
LVEVESADPECSEDGPLLGPPRLPVRPRSRPAVCAVVENGARTGAMIAGTDGKSIVRSVIYGRSGSGSLPMLSAVCLRLPAAAQHAARPSRGVARRQLLAAARCCSAAST